MSCKEAKIYECGFCCNVKMHPLKLTGLCLIDYYYEELLKDTNVKELLRSLISKGFLGPNGFSSPHLKAAVNKYYPEHNELFNKLLVLI